MEIKPLCIEDIGKKIREYRKSLGLSQERLGEAVGVDPTLISRIENGRKSNLTVDLLMQIAEVFHVTMDALCYETAGTEPDDVTGALLSDQKEAVNALAKLSDMERFFLMKMIRGVA